MFVGKYLFRNVARFHYGTLYKVTFKFSDNLICRREKMINYLHPSHS